MRRFGGRATKLRYASSLFNLMRNLGGAVGIATANTWLQDQARIHFARLGEALGDAGRQGSEVVAAVAARIGEYVPDPQLALLMAQAQFGQLVSREATTLAFGQ